MLLVAFIGWIVKYISEQNQKASKANMAPPQRPRAHDDRFQSEIDLFLQDVAGKRKDDDVMIEVVPEDELRLRHQMDEQSEALGTLEERTLGTRHLGSGVEKSVDRHMHEDSFEEHVLEAEGEGLKTNIRPTSRPAAATTVRRHQVISSQFVANWLRDPQDVRKAIIISEVLSPCRGLRGRRG